MSIPQAASGVVTFYLSLPASMAELAQVATGAATPGSSTYRHSHRWTRLLSNSAQPLPRSTR
jgi:hypothetical protein